MGYKNRTSFVILTLTASACIISSYLLYFYGMGSFYIYVIWSLLTIIMPLLAGLYIYKNRPARMSFVLAGIGMFLAIVFTVDTVATRKTFEYFCSQLGPGHNVIGRSDYYICTAPSEADYVHIGQISGLAGLLFLPYLLVGLINALHLIYLPFRFLFLRGKKHHT